MKSQNELSELKTSISLEETAEHEKARKVREKAQNERALDKQIKRASSILIKKLKPALNSPSLKAFLDDFIDLREGEIDRALREEKNADAVGTIVFFTENTSPRAVKLQLLKKISKGEFDPHTIKSICKIYNIPEKEFYKFIGYALQYLEIMHHTFGTFRTLSNKIGILNQHIQRLNLRIQRETQIKAQQGKEFMSLDLQAQRVTSNKESGNIIVAMNDDWSALNGVRIEEFILLYLKKIFDKLFKFIPLSENQDSNTYFLKELNLTSHSGAVTMETLKKHLYEKIKIGKLSLDQLYTIHELMTNVHLEDNLNKLRKELANIGIKLSKQEGMRLVRQLSYRRLLPDYLLSILPPNINFKEIVTVKRKGLFSSKEYLTAQYLEELKKLLSTLNDDNAELQIKTKTEIEYLLQQLLPNYNPETLEKIFKHALRFNLDSRQASGPSQFTG